MENPGTGIDLLPLHMKGEYLAGMAQSAPTDRHPAESAQFVEKTLTTMPATPYALLTESGRFAEIGSGPLLILIHGAHS